jgi:hypothetical protein
MKKIKGQPDRPRTRNNIVYAFMINNNFLTHIHAKDPIYPLSDEPKVVVA